MNIGHDAILRLKSLIAKEEASRSSHWQYYLESFSFDGTDAAGLVGFGGYSPYSPFRQFAHDLMQLPYRWDVGKGGWKRFLPISRQIAHTQGRCFDLDQLRQVFSAGILSDYGVLEGEGLLVVIGDGFGSLSTLLTSALTRKLVLVNLVPVLMVDICFMLRARPQSDIALVESAADFKQAVDDPTFGVIAVPADKCDLLLGAPIGAAVNIASMQEMDPKTVARYFSILRASSLPLPWFYCCNREEKFLPDGTAVRILDYPWNPDDELLVDALCPWHQRYYSLRPPRYMRYDGPIRHRLARLTNIQKSTTGGISPALFTSC